MSLESRRLKFKELSGRFECQRPSELVSVHKISEPRFGALRSAAATYMSRCLPELRFVIDEPAILGEFLRQRAALKNVTPNGMIVPKRELVFEYNMIVKAFTDIISELNIADFIASWHIPLNLRYKDGEVVKENLLREHATEVVHSDSWAGESADSVAVYIPIFGDIGHNFIELYDPPEDFSEQWLKPLQTYLDGAGIAARYRKIGIQQKPGHVYLADFGTMHATTRVGKSGARVSIDTTFALKRSGGENEMAQQKMHPWRLNERLSHESLCAVGRTKMFVFPDSINDQWRPGHFRHPTDPKVVDIL